MNRKAFTLVELLIVIVIIASLLGITLPAIRHCKQKVQSLTCISNLRQLTLALNSYANDSTSYPYGFSDQPGMLYPPPEGYSGSSTADWVGWWWFELIGEVIKSSSAMDCPGSREDMLYKNLRGNYGVNYSICKISPLAPKETEFIGKPLKATQIHQPAGVLLVMDAGYSLISWKAATGDPSMSFENPKRNPWFYVPGLTSINERKTIDSAKTEDAIAGRHPGKTINAGFCDGHVDSLDAESLAVERLPDTPVPHYRYWSP
ncbi:MAG: type II secretion system protein [Anaerohalosphaeraceae bacterium]